MTLIDEAFQSMARDRRELRERERVTRGHLLDVLSFLNRLEIGQVSDPRAEASTLRRQLVLLMELRKPNPFAPTPAPSGAGPQEAA